MYILTFWFLLSTMTNARSVNVKAANSYETVVHQRRRSRDATKPVTKVFSHIPCESSLAEEDKIGKKTLDEIHTYAELKNDPRASLPESFTVCSSMMTTSCKNYVWPAFFTILDENRTQFLAPIISRWTIESALQILYLQGSSEQVDGKIPPLFPNQWTRTCLAINVTSGLIQYVVQGTLVLTTISEEVRDSKRQPKDLSRKLILGAISYGGSVYITQGQKVTNLNIFSSTLSIEEMKSITEGESCLMEGDYLAWEDMEWILHGQAGIETVEKENTCQVDPFLNLYYTRFPDMDACMHHCENLGTRVPSVTTSEDWATLQRSLKMNLYDRGLNTLRLWLPVEDRKTEGDWIDFYTGNALQDYTPPWAASKPVGGTGANCAYLLDGNTWSDFSCDSSQSACMCSHKPTSYLEFRGLCPGSLVDVFYKPVNDLTDSRQLKLQGLEGTLIWYDKKEKLWILDLADSNVTGISRASHASFTLGKHNWTVKGDKDCNDGEPYVTELKMSGCQQGKFTCSDGQCVGMDLRCDQLPDCRDESDEKNCNILVLKDGYNKRVPPLHFGEPVNVSVSMNVLKLVDINEDDYSIEIQFEISMMWNDNRVTYQNLKTRDSLNALKETDFEHLWLPKVIYENTDQKVTTRLGSIWEWETRVVVKRGGNYSLSKLDTLDETEIFTGFENSLIMSQTYTHTFQCNYKLSYYPFDTQVYLEAFLLTFLETFFTDLLNRHGNGKPGHDCCDSDSRPADYDPRSRHAYLSYY